MYIEPNSLVYLLRDVPLTPSQENTILFKSKSAQTSYMQSKAVKSFNKVSYQRVNKGTCRVQCSADEVYTCNYMAFQNTGYGNKWFYAFITSVEYINNATTEISFVIDPIQTYWFDITLKQCFVEREHHTSDTFSDWMIPENLSTGKMEYDQIQRSGLFSEWGILVVSAYDENGGISETGYNIGGVNTSCFVLYFANGSDLSTYISKLDTAGKTDGIISVFMFPTLVLAAMGVAVESGHAIYNIPQNKPASFSVRKPATKIGTYTPKNGKLFTYPYSYLTLSNSNGGTLELRWELFTQDTSNPFCTFNIYADYISNAYLCTPVNYAGSGSDQTSVSGATNVALNFAIGMNGCPQIPWVNDTYKIYLAQNKVSMLMNEVGIAKDLVQGVSMKDVSSLQNAFDRTTSLLDANYRASLDPAQVHTGGGNNSMFQSGFFDFYTSHTHVVPEIAKTIDDYFSMYGYATNEVKVPNTNARPHWTYTKTVACIITGGAPSDDIQTIQNCFNNGIRFWNNPSEVGNYNLDNSPS